MPTEVVADVNAGAKGVVKTAATVVGTVVGVKAVGKLKDNVLGKDTELDDACDHVKLDFGVNPWKDTPGIFLKKIISGLEGAEKFHITDWKNVLNSTIEAIIRTLNDMKKNTFSYNDLTSCAKRMDGLSVDSGDGVNILISFYEGITSDAISAYDTFDAICKRLSELGLDSSDNKLRQKVDEFNKACSVYYKAFNDASNMGKISRGGNILKDSKGNEIQYTNSEGKQVCLYDFVDTAAESSKKNAVMKWVILHILCAYVVVTYAFRRRQVRWRWHIPLPDFLYKKVLKKSGKDITSSNVPDRNDIKEIYLDDLYSLRYTYGMRFPCKYKSQNMDSSDSKTTSSTPESDYVLEGWRFLRCVLGVCKQDISINMNSQEGLIEPNSISMNLILKDVKKLCNSKWLELCFRGDYQKYYHEIALRTKLEKLKDEIFEKFEELNIGSSKDDCVTILCGGCSQESQTSLATLRNNVIKCMDAVNDSQTENFMLVENSKLAVNSNILKKRKRFFACKNDTFDFTSMDKTNFEDICQYKKLSTAHKEFSTVYQTVQEQLAKMGLATSEIQKGYSETNSSVTSQGTSAKFKKILQFMHDSKFNYNSMEISDTNTTSITFTNLLQHVEKKCGDLYQKCMKDIEEIRTAGVPLVEGESRKNLPSNNKVTFSVYLCYVLSILYVYGQMLKMCMSNFRGYYNKKCHELIKSSSLKDVALKISNKQNKQNEPSVTNNNWKKRAVDSLNAGYLRGM